MRPPTLWREGTSALVALRTDAPGNVANTPLTVPGSVGRRFAANGAVTKRHNAVFKAAERSS